MYRRATPPTVHRPDANARGGRGPSRSGWPRRWWPGPAPTRGGNGRSRPGSALGLERLDQRGEHLVHVAHDPEVRYREDGSLLVLVDGDDVLGALHAHQVLGGTRDPTGHVDRRLHRLAGLADLVRVRHPAGVDDGAAGTGGAVQQLCELFDHGVVGGLAETPTTRDH